MTRHNITRDNSLTYRPLVSAAFGLSNNNKWRRTHSPSRLVWSEVWWLVET